MIRPLDFDLLTTPQFGKSFNPGELEHMVGNDYDDGCFKDAPNLLPQFEMWRMNLTAFSQCYNLYFVAFRNQIYVYRPRNLNQAIPGKPDLVIRPPPITGLPKRRSIFPDHPHCINSFIVGELGILEIIVFAFDDGDVYAFYTKDIEAAVQIREIDPSLSALAEIKPLLRENLDDSAWGLAVAKELRIIAVSTNGKNISLFCFALNDDVTAEYDDAVIFEETLSVRCKCSNFHETRYHPRYDHPLKATARK